MLAETYPRDRTSHLLDRFHSHQQQAVKLLQSVRARLNVLEEVVDPRELPPPQQTVPAKTMPMARARLQLLVNRLLLHDLLLQKLLLSQSLLHELSHLVLSKELLLLLRRLRRLQLLPLCQHQPPPTQQPRDQLPQDQLPQKASPLLLRSPLRPQRQATRPLLPMPGRHLLLLALVLLSLPLDRSRLVRRRQDLSHLTALSSSIRDSLQGS